MEDCFGVDCYDTVDWDFGGVTDFDVFGNAVTIIETVWAIIEDGKLGVELYEDYCIFLLWVKNVGEIFVEIRKYIKWTV